MLFLGMFLIVSSVFFTLVSAEMQEGNEEVPSSVVTVNGNSIITVADGNDIEINKKKVIFSSQGIAREVESVNIEEIGDDYKFIIEHKDFIREVESEVKIESKSRIINGEEKYEFKVKFSNGHEEQLNVLPEEAVSKAIGILGITSLKSKDFEVRLVETVNERKYSAVYEIESEIKGRFLGLFNTSYIIEADIDSETGNVIDSYDGPWWSGLLIK